jgi:hypothetical protein
VDHDELKSLASHAGPQCSKLGPIDRSRFFDSLILDKPLHVRIIDACLFYAIPHRDSGGGLLTKTVTMCALRISIFGNHQNKAVGCSYLRKEKQVSWLQAHPISLTEDYVRGRN